MNKSMNLSGMTYNDLKAGYEALMVSINEQMEKCREYQQAMDIKRANDVKEALRFLMDTYGLTQNEMKTYLDGEDSITPVTIKEVDDQTEAVDISEVVEIAQAGDEEPLALPESSQEGEVETEVSINPEPQEENKGESKTTSVFDHPALKAPYSLVTANKKSATPVDKTSVEKAIEFALTQTTNHEGFYPLIKERFLEAGVVLVVLPNLQGSKTNGATKKIGKSVMMMVNDRRLYADSFWFTLLHEAGHVIYGDYGISFEGDAGDIEQKADEYAENKLIDPQLYQSFVSKSEGHFTASSIVAFANSIDRDPGIILGRLENDGYLKHGNGMQSLRSKYHVQLRE